MSCQPYGIFRKVRSVNATNTSFPSKIPTIVEPTGTGDTGTAASVIDLAHPPGGGLAPEMAKFIFYGTGDADDVFDVRLIGWQRAQSEPSNTLWVPTLLATFTCVMGTAAGVSGGYLVATDLIVDAITIGSEPTTAADTTPDGKIKLYSPSNNLIAYVEVPLLGSQKIELTFDMTTNDPTGANALMALR